LKSRIVRVTQKLNDSVDFEFGNQYLKPKIRGFDSEKIKYLRSIKTVVFSNLCLTKFRLEKLVRLYGIYSLSKPTIALLLGF